MSSIYIAGHTGLVGSAIHRLCKLDGRWEIITATHKELDLTDQRAVDAFLDRARPDYIILAAAKVGGILENSRFPVEFFISNMNIQQHVIQAAARIPNLKKLLFLGSSCIYPKFAPQPIKEESLLSGYLEPTNEAYAIAKIGGLKFCQYYNEEYGKPFISCMPTNLYGPNDNFDLSSSHVLPALIRKFHEAKATGADVTVWGDGSPRREFLHVDDLARACMFLVENYNDKLHVNVGYGSDVSIKELAEEIASVTGFQGKLVWDTEKPNGTPRKLLDSSRLAGMGWAPRITLQEGIRSTYEWYVNNIAANPAVH